jgi:hypothetical protein
MVNRFDSANYPETEPANLVIGELWAWKRPDLAGTYDPSLYTATYISNKESSDVASFTISATGSDFTVSEADTSAICPEGRYRWELVITQISDSAKVGVARGYWDVLPDLTTGPTDNRSHARKVLDAVEAVIEGSATKEQSSISIAGRSLALRTYDELRQIRIDYRAEVESERQSELQKQGKGSTTKILTRFPA